MGCLLILMLAGAMIAANWATLYALQRRRAGLGWWIALCGAWILGAAVGVIGTFHEFQPSPKLRVVGRPMPVVIFQLEGPPGQEQWIDFVSPLGPLVIGVNAGSLALLAGLPVGLLRYLCSWWSPRPGTRSP